MAAAPRLSPLLSLEGLTRRYAGLLAVDAVHLAIAPGGIHALIGPNGAGKTTLFDMISGVTAPSAGRIVLDGRDITAWPPHRRARLGLARTFQAIRLFPGMTLLETASVGSPGAGLVATLLGLPAHRRAEAAALRAARGALDRMGLLGREGERAERLSYGDQRRLEIARALATGPRLLLLDEPAAGLNPVETQTLAVLIRAIAAEGVTVLLVEHDMGFVMRLADSVTVLSFGRKLFQGPPEAARADPAVIEAYLGHRLAARLAKPADPP